MVVFALTSQGNDFYTAMTRVAVASLRQSNPTLRLVVVCDRDTDLSIKLMCNPIVAEVDEWIMIETPTGDPFFRSRYVKTSLRGIIDGPFLFLDCDIFVRGNLDPIFELDADIAGARNHSREAFAEQVWVQDAATLDAMNWPIQKNVYINTGVIFFNDTQGARKLGDEWHRRWSQSFHIRKNHRDQPAFNSAIYDIRPVIAVLPDRFNAQFKATPSVAGDAVLWHYYSSVEDAPHTLFELLVDELINGAKLDRERVSAMIESSHPWRSDNKVDDFAANAVMRRGRFDGWESAWLRRELKQHILGRTRRALSRMKRIINHS